jgi:uncharacterized repeat protein (TIGR03843 family)
MASELWPGNNWCPDLSEIQNLLADSSVDSCELLPSGSNYVFLVRLDAGEAGRGLGVYKPRRGEAPLWDYPGGNLYRREAATYLMCRTLGWNFVPPTVIRDGPHGIGTVQLFIEHDPRQTFFSLRDSRVVDMQRMALFDTVVNNGDRKGGHCLLGLDGRIWGIDHGLTFHSENKLRTVIWDFAGQQVPRHLLADLETLRRQLADGAALASQLCALISDSELTALRRRLDRVLADKRYPTQGFRRSIPWPPV